MRNYMKLRKNNKGFSLVELILVLGLSSLIFIGVLSIEKKRTETLKSEAVGQQMKEVGEAFSNYVSDQRSVFLNNIPVNTSINFPLSVLQGVTSGVYIGKQYLPASFNTLNAFGTGYMLQVRNNGGSSITGLLITDAPVIDESGSVRYDWLGYAARVAGAQSGMSFFSPTQVTGLNAGWSLPSSEYSTINAAGKLAYRTQSTGNNDDTYLRRDGLYPMTGNLNMGNNNIRDATDINFFGYLNGNNALLNNLQTGYIVNNGNIQNNGNMQNNGVIVTSEVRGLGMSATTSNATTGATAAVLGPDVATFTRYIARHDVQTPFINRNGGDLRIGNGSDSNLYVKDIFLTNSSSGSGRVINNWLIDRLPRYVSKGQFIVTNGATVPAPLCGSGGSPRIEVIPKRAYVQGRVFNGASPSAYSVGEFDAYATGSGPWTVTIVTPQYAPSGYQGTNAIANTYCDMGS